MPTKSISIFLLASLLIFTTNAVELQRFALRNLAATNPIERHALVKYGYNTAVLVNLEKEYLSRNNMTNKSETAMIVVLSSNVTGFCRDCEYFQKYNCTDNVCNADPKIKQSFTSPLYCSTEANPIFQSVSIGNSTTPAWKAFKTSLFNRSSFSYEHINSPSGMKSGIANYSTYGVLGLGVGGPALFNFRGDHPPVFSISINATTGLGQLIFGKDSSLYNASTNPIVLKTDSNWTMLTKKMSFGSNYSSTSYVSKLVFDLQHPGISIPSGYYSSTNGLFLKNLQNISNMSIDRREDNFYTFNGTLSDLPNFVFSLENGQNLTIPPDAYTRKSRLYNNTYVILIGNTDAVAGENKTLTNYTVLGQSVLSYFYAIFEQKTEGQETVTLYSADKSQPIADSSSFVSNHTSFVWKFAQIAVVIFVLVAIVFCLKNRAANKLKEELYVELGEQNHMVRL